MWLVLIKKASLFMVSTISKNEGCFQNWIRSSVNFSEIFYIKVTILLTNDYFKQYFSESIEVGKIVDRYYLNIFYKKW